jgi:hypothetical protein
LNDENKTLDDLIADIQNEMKTMSWIHEDYTTRLTVLERLYELKAKDRPPRISHDTLLTVGGQLLGILVIVGYERSHVMMSKGLSLLKRPT